MTGTEITAYAIVAAVSAPILVRIGRVTSLKFAGLVALVMTAVALVSELAAVTGA
jgi:predicted MFS family arabinose efflux permease